MNFKIMDSLTYPPHCHVFSFLYGPWSPSNSLVAPTEPHTLRVHLICIRISRSLSCRQFLRGSWSIRIIISAIQMCHLMQNTACLVIIIIRTSGSILREVPVAVIRAGDNSVVAWHRVEQSTAVGAVAVDVSAVDRWRGGLYPLDVCIYGADFGLLRGGLEPDGEVIGGTAGSSVGSSGERNCIRNASFERTCLRART